RIDCIVASVLGPTATLIPVREVLPETLELLEAGSPAYLSFTHHGALVALRGVASAASASGDEVYFVVTDGVQVPQRRGAERVPLITHAQLQTIDDAGNAIGPTIDTVTANLSSGGALIAVRPGIGESPRFAIQFFFGRERTAVRCEASLARRTATHIGVGFTRMDAADRAVLANILADYERRRQAALHVAERPGAGLKRA
ncbi:MAG: PilZ domain-containing protein, partial [Solirubrobacteraceae bacterium]